MTRPASAGLFLAPQMCFCPAAENDWARGCYAVLFEAADRMRVETNFVPGRGRLA